MLVLTEPVRIYGKYVISDLATREPGAVRNTYSPYGGMRHVVNKFWPKGTSSTEADIELMFDKQPDFDADMKQPQNTVEDGDLTALRDEEDKCAPYNPAIDTYPILRYYRRLEDIAEFYVKEYLTNTVYSIVSREIGGLRQFVSENMEQNALFSNSDDGDGFEELADLVLEGDVNEWSAEVQQEAADRLPYVLKRLHTLSCYCNIHMLSFIAAYLKAKEENDVNRSNGSTMTLKVNAVIQKGIYRCDKDGLISKQIEVKNRSKQASLMFDWITGQSTSYESYLVDYKNFVHYCDVLNIDIIHDDLSKYDMRFIQKLTVAVVTPNTQYDKQVFAVLHAGLTPAPAGINKSEVDPISNTFELFNELAVSDEWLSRGIANVSTSSVKEVQSLCYQFFYLYDQLACKMIPGRVSKNVMEIDLSQPYATYQGELVMLNSDWISNAIFADKRCLFSTTGYLIMVTSYDMLDVMSLGDALQNVMFRLRGESMPNKWRRLLP